MTKDKSIWRTSHSLVQDTRSRDALISKFVENRDSETLTIYHEMTIKNTILAIADKMVECLKVKGINPVIKSDDAKWLAIEGGNVLIIVSDEERRDDDYGIPYEASENKAGSLLEARVGAFGITIVGDRELLIYLTQQIKSTYHNQHFARIKWWYDDSGRSSYKTTYLDNPNTVIRPEFYPDMEDPESFIKDYLASDSSVLLMAGPPGTGKTTLLRHMIYEHNLTASVVYDERLMERDAVFQSFIFDKSDNILIIEDADVILTRRDLENNRLMGRFLNISDGLIKLPNKKLVFTTNLTDFSKVDDALMRPGRCFSVVQTRLLHADEAVTAARAAHLPIPLEKREYTIAELFNQGRKTFTPRRVGFRH